MKYLANTLMLILLVIVAWAAYIQSPSPSADAAPHAQSDVQAIQAWLDRYCATVTAGDLEGYRAFWTEDVVWLPPNTPIRTGIEACMEHNRPLFEYYTAVETMTADEIQVEGSLAFARVRYTYQGTPKPGVDVEPLKEDGKGMFILRRRPDGSWVSTHCVWNSNLPVPD
jgi:uncharacterized protein (TIGR02246 family)